MPGRYFVLDEPCPRHEIESMMGRVVLDIKLPLRAFAPKAPTNPQHIFPDILPKPTLAINRRDFLQNNVSHDVRPSLSDLFGFHIAKTDDERLILESKLVKRYSLTQHKDVFDRLMQDPSYNKDVRQLFETHRVRKAYFVVGFLTTEKALWSHEKARGHAAGFKVQIPVSVLAYGAPFGPDVNLKFANANDKVRRHSFASVDEEIFAVAYDVVKLKRSFDKTVPGYFKTDLTLGPAKYAKGRHLAMGVDRDNLIVEEEEDSDSEEDSMDAVEFGGDLDLIDLDPKWAGVSFSVLDGES